MIPAFVNPQAGGAGSIREALTSSGQFRVSEVSPREMTQAARAAIANGATRIAVAGGDGSISAMAAVVADTSIELAVIPAGTLNHFARDHGIPSDPDAACAAAVSGGVRRVDVGRVNGRVFLNTSSVGIYANFVRVRDRIEPKVGYRVASLLAMAKTFARVRSFNAWFEAEGFQRPYVTPLVFVGLGERELRLPKLGGRVRHGRPGLHVLIVRGRTRARLTALALAAAARGTRALTRTPHLDGFLVEHCTVEQRHSTVAVDGEIVVMDSPLRYELARGALRLVVPTAASRVPASRAPTI